MVLNLGAYQNYLRGLFNINVSIHTHSYCKGCVWACRGSWKHALCQSYSGNSDIFPYRHCLKKGMTIEHFFPVWYGSSAWALCPHQNVYMCLTVCMCHWVPVSSVIIVFMHLFVHPLCVDVTCCPVIDVILSVESPCCVCVCCRTCLS